MITPFRLKQEIFSVASFIIVVCVFTKLNYYNNDNCSTDNATT